MPFTPSHAVVALPFVRTVLPVGAVAIGSMMPDLPMFLTGGRGYDITHGWPGLLLVDFPLALAAFAGWRIVVRPVLRGVLPQRLGERLPPGWDGSPADGARSIWHERGRSVGVSLLALVAALLIGVLSHLLWDAFTHVGRVGAEVLPVLEEPIAGLALARWLQYISSVAGLLGLAVYGVWWFRRKPAVPVARRVPPVVVVLFWLAVVAVFAVGVLAGARILLQ